MATPVLIEKDGFMEIGNNLEQLELPGTTSYKYERKVT